MKCDSKVINISIIGGGPMCTYALERLSVLLVKAIDSRFHISIFESSGEFGSGQVHSTKQPECCYMNRIASQVSFASDSSTVDDLSNIVESNLGSLADWCVDKHIASKDGLFDIQERSTPNRRLHGLALVDSFQKYYKELEQQENISLKLYPYEVIDVQESTNNDAFLITYKGSKSKVLANYVLFVTGHSHVFATKEKKESESSDVIFPVYPLETQVTDQIVPRDSMVGIDGLGLTAIDLALYLTEGRGGKFILNQGSKSSPYRYVSSGKEPKRIVGFGSSGFFPYCRPENFKQVGKKCHDYHPQFFTLSAVNVLRSRLGRTVYGSTGNKIKQLDFEVHLMPLVKLEMQYAYYQTLFGKEFAQCICSEVDNIYQYYLNKADFKSPMDSKFDTKIDQIFDHAAKLISSFLTSISIESLPESKLDRSILKSFLLVIYGIKELDVANLKELVSKNSTIFGHSQTVFDHKFSWDRVINPFSYDPSIHQNEEFNWGKKLLDFVKLDYLAALQNNIKNPNKVAFDGVWRDLRYVFTHAADRGGLTAKSEIYFRRKVLRLANRLGNGPSTEAMAKIIALIEFGILDVSIGPNPKLVYDDDSSKYFIYSQFKKEPRVVEQILKARVPYFYEGYKMAHLYKNMIGSGMIQQWVNPDFTQKVTGGINLSSRFHPIDELGYENKKLTFLGTPADGLVYFQSSAARPNVGSGVLRAASNWAEELIACIQKNK